MAACCGGVPGGVLDGKLLLICFVVCSDGIHLKQTSLGLGPKLIPPQELHGGVGGGVHGYTVLGGGWSGGADSVSVCSSLGGRNDDSGS